MFVYLARRSEQENEDKSAQMDNKQPDKEIQTSNQPAVEDSEEEENEILEESPCGRWLKRTEEVIVCLFS